jgi:hypothetical protein
VNESHLLFTQQELAEYAVVFAHTDRRLALLGGFVTWLRPVVCIQH